jgi:hopene-associated glycosyltransferase HpnB
MDTLLACAALAVWTYLLTARGGFWMAGVRDEGGPLPENWPSVMAVIPARDEADSVGDTIRSLLRQDYRGDFGIILVDDQSTDGTADVARRAAQEMSAGDRLTVLAGADLPTGWTGKLWAMKQGIERASAEEPKNLPKYLLLTDADITYEPDALSRLVAKAESGDLVLTSWMVKLRCESFAEHALIPAFVFFFEMLYPFDWVRQRDNRTAAAAGGCMLTRRDALAAAGGIESIRGALIDDCALAAQMKRQGPIWLGLTERAHSARPYPEIEDVRRMVARSAYAQLQYSPILLAGTVAGMAIIYLAPVLLALFGSGFASTAGWVVWAAMAIAYQPILKFYKLPPYWGAFLPAIALAYMAFTLDSAYQNAQGKGGLWKGRVQAKAAE